MCFKKKEKFESGFYQDRQLLLLMGQEMDLLIMMCKDKNLDIEQDLIKIKDMLIYVSPSESKNMYDLDLKIKSKVQDLKINLMREDIKDVKFLQRCVKDLKILIKDREVRELK